MDIAKYLEERRRRYPTAARLKERALRAEELKKAGVLQNRAQPSEAIPKYELYMKGKNTAVRRQASTVMDYLLRPAQHGYNSLLSEALTFIQGEGFLQGDIPEGYRYTYQSSWVVSAPAVQKEEAKCVPEAQEKEGAGAQDGLRTRQLPDVGSWLASSSGSESSSEPSSSSESSSASSHSRSRPQPLQ